MKRIFCFGDSNTYGFDPAPDWGDDRYPASVRWTARLNAHPGWEILNYGENGRQIPHTPTALGLLYRELLAAAPLAVFVVMLGSNDLFWMAWPTPEALAQRMDGLLELVAWQRISGLYHADALGDFIGTLAWNGRAFALTTQTVGILGYSIPGEKSF